MSKGPLLRVIIAHLQARTNELCSKFLLISWARTQSLRRSLRSLTFSKVLLTTQQLQRTSLRISYGKLSQQTKEWSFSEKHVLGRCIFYSQRAGAADAADEADLIKISVANQAWYASTTSDTSGTKGLVRVFAHGHKPQRRIKSSGRSMHGADFSTLPSGPQLFNMCWANRAATLCALFWPHLPKVHCKDCGCMHWFEQNRALATVSCAFWRQLLPKLVSMDPFHRKFTNRKQTFFLPSKTEGLLVSNSLQYSSNKSWMLGAFNKLEI